MKDKYYTPTIEEFHIGFEYEIAGLDNYWALTGWHKEIVDEEFDYKLLKKYPQYYRVKYLDQEDLIELGWEPKGSGWYKLKKVSGRLGYWTHVMFHIWGDDSPIIGYRGEPNTALEDQHLFVGEIKNKSEMKRIMKQIKLA